MSSDAKDATTDTTLEFYGGPLVSLLPLVLFVLWAIVQSGLLRISDPGGLVVGILVSLIVGMLFVRGSWSTYAEALFAGMTRKVAATAIVCWVWAGMFADTLQAGQFVEGLVWLAGSTGVGPVLFPLVTFWLAAILATGIGTGYGTVIAFAGLFFPAGVLLGADPVLLFGAILAGAIFGDNMAPVSDTTIVSAVTQEADIGGVVSSRFKYALIAAVLSSLLYVVLALDSGSSPIASGAESMLLTESEPLALVHLISMGVVILAAVSGRHIIESISWGIFFAVGFNLLLGLSTMREVLVFRVPESLGIAGWFERPEGLLAERLWPFEVGSEAAVGGSLYSGATGFFTMSVLILFIVAAAQVMTRGGGFELIQEWVLDTLARTVRSAEVSMVLSTVAINAMITINTAAEIAIAPFIRKTGRRFNLNGYRRANILDANTSALGYIFPWSGGVLVGYEALQELPGQYEWFETAYVVQPAEVWPYVFQGWFLVGVFLIAALTGFGREYVTDRGSEEMTRA